MTCQRHRPPLGHPSAGRRRAVAERRKVRRLLPLPADIFVENLIHDPADRIVDGPAVNERLIVSGAVCNVKRIAFRPIPFCVNPIQRKGDNSVNVRPQCILRPGRIDLTAGHIFHIVGKGYLYVGRCAVRRPQMHCNRIRDDNLPQHLPGLRALKKAFRLPLPLRRDRRTAHHNFRRHPVPFLSLHRNEYKGKISRFTVKNRNVRDIYRIKSFRLRRHMISDIGRARKILILRIAFVHRFKRYFSRLTIFVRHQLINPVLFVVQNSDPYPLKRQRVVRGSRLHGQIPNRHNPALLHSLVSKSPML